MSESVPSDAVNSVRATLERAGRTDRPKVTLPEEVRDQAPEGEVVHLSLGGAVRHATVELAIDDTLEIRGAYDNARMAREGEGPNRLAEWADEKGLDFGRTVHLDVVDAGFFYGLRAPGERAVYTVTKRPDRGLQDIADSLYDDQ